MKWTYQQVFGADGREDTWRMKNTVEFIPCCDEARDSSTLKVLDSFRGFKFGLQSETWDGDVTDVEEIHFCPWCAAPVVVECTGRFRVVLKEVQVEVPARTVIEKEYVLEPLE